MQHNLTIVSAFIGGINKSPNKSIDLYLRYGYQLMRIKIPKILFIDETLIDQLKKIGDDISYEYNYIIPYKLTDIYLYQYVNQLKNVSVCSSNPQKDTIEYFMVQCHKTEWIRQAIELNRYNSVNYMWIDFGIYQFIDKLNLSTEEKFNQFSNSLYQIEYQKTDLIRMPQMWNLKATCNNFHDYMKKHICWYFGGSLFGGNKDNLIKFAQSTKQQCLKMIIDESWLVWELNIWYLVYQETPQLFETYWAKHDLSIFEKYKDDLIFRIPINQYDGLGNKLKALIGSLSINKNTKIQSQKGVPYSDFRSILPEKYIFNQETDHHYQDYYTSRLLILKREEHDQKNLINEYSNHSFNIEGLNYLFSSHHIDSHYDKNQLSTEVTTRILNTINSLQFLPHIYEHVNQMTNFGKLFDNPTLSVNIRTWKASHEHNINRPYHPSVYMDRITEVIQKHPTITNIFVTIDNEQYMKEYYKFFESLKKPIKIHFYETKHTLTDLENALIQVLIASKCQYMIGNRVSSFTELIYWFSNLKIEVYTTF